MIAAAAQRSAAPVSAGARAGRGILAALAICSPLLAVKGATLELGDVNLPAAQDSAAKLAVSLKNPSATVVGLQFDLVYSDGLASPGIPSLPESDTDHQLDVRLVEPGRYRVLLFSKANKPLEAPYNVDLRFGFTDLAPEGGPAMRIENVFMAAEDGSMIPASIAYGPIGAWRNNNFTDAQWNNKGTGGDSGDTDGDGLGNLQEFYFQTDPVKGSGDSVDTLLGGTIVSDGEGGKILRLTWRERKDVQGVAPLVAGGADPANLTDIIPAEVQSEDAGFRDLKAEASAAGASAYFLELKMRRSPAP